MRRTLTFLAWCLALLLCAGAGIADAKAPSDREKGPKDPPPGKTRDEPVAPPPAAPSPEATPGAPPAPDPVPPAPVAAPAAALAPPEEEPRAAPMVVPTVETAFAPAARPAPDASLPPEPAPRAAPPPAGPVAALAGALAPSGPAPSGVQGASAVGASPVASALLWGVPLAGLVLLGVVLSAGRLVQPRLLPPRPAPAPEPPAAVALAPRDLDGLLRAAKAATEAERLEEAVALFDKALRLAPGLAVAHFCRGVCLAGLARHRDAYAALRRAYDLDPQEAAFRLELARACGRLGRNAEAMDVLGPLLAALPSLVEDVTTDPCFAGLLDHPRFLAMTGKL